MSHFSVDVVPVVLESHGNADSLSIVRIGGFQVVVKTDDWRGERVGAYIPPDSVVDVTRPEFSFLGDHSRITVRRFRGQWSQGLLVRAPIGSKVGDDVAKTLGVTHYEPPIRAWTPGQRGVCTNAAKQPPGLKRPVYDIENARKFQGLFAEGEHVVITEKIHGCNARYTFQDGKMYAGSRNQWRKNPDEKTVWERFINWARIKTAGAKWLWRALGKMGVRHSAFIGHDGRTTPTCPWWLALKQNPAIEAFCRANPGVTVYGEIYGELQDLDYGMEKGQIGFRAFDLWRDGVWVDHSIQRVIGADLPWAPVLYSGPFVSHDHVCNLAEGKSTMPNAKHVREGVVVKPVKERYDGKLGRVQLKAIGNGYLERSGKEKD